MTDRTPDLSATFQDRIPTQIRTLLSEPCPGKRQEVSN